MPRTLSSHTRATLQALFVTFLWSTSWVLIKLGLEDIPALTFAGLRYWLAFLCLAPLAARPAQRDSLRQLSRRDWGRLAALGLVYYAVTMGTQFLGLERLPAITASLLLSFSPIMVALLGIAFLAEPITRQQWGGIGLYLAGALIYFYPVAIPTEQVIGLIIVFTSVIANALSSALGRSVNRVGTITPLIVTVVSMGIGALVLLVAGIASQGMPALDGRSWAIIIWLAVVNTAFAFTLWNHTLRTLPAVESSVINNTMLIQVAALAWIFLGEELNGREIAGLALAAIGALIVQVRRARTRAESPTRGQAATPQRSSPGSR